MMTGEACPASIRCWHVHGVVVKQLSFDFGPAGCMGGLVALFVWNGSHRYTARSLVWPWWLELNHDLGAGGGLRRVGMGDLSVRKKDVDSINVTISKNLAVVICIYVRSLLGHHC